MRFARWLFGATLLCHSAACDDCVHRTGSVAVTYILANDAGGNVVTDQFLIESGATVRDVECINRDCHTCCKTSVDAAGVLRHSIESDLASLVPVGNPDCTGMQTETLTIVRYDAAGNAVAQITLECQQIDRARMDPTRGAIMSDVIAALHAMANQIAPNCN